MNTIRELYNYREMIASLVRKDLRGRYKGSVLGFLWTFINPLFQLIIYTIVFSTILRSDIEKYYLFLFVALIPWIFFSSALVNGSTSVLAQKSMVTKIYFPRAVLPIAYVTSSFINMLYCFIIVFVVVLIAGIKISFSALLCLPAIMLIEYIFAMGIALFTSSITVYFRDFEHILGIINMGWMYMTPIIYSIEIIPEKYKSFFYLNPMTYIISSYREVLYYGRVPEMSLLIPSLVIGIVFLVTGLMFFNKLQKHFAEEL